MVIGVVGGSFVMVSGVEVWWNWIWIVYVFSLFLGLWVRGCEICGCAVSGFSEFSEVCRHKRHVRLGVQGQDALFSECRVQRVEWQGAFSVLWVDPVRGRCWGVFQEFQCVGDVSDFFRFATRGFCCRI